MLSSFMIGFRPVRSYTNVNPFSNRLEHLYKVKKVASAWKVI